MKKLLFLMVAAVALTGASPRAGTATLHLEPGVVADAALAPGSTFTVDVKCDLDLADAVGGVSMVLEYDPSVFVLAGHTLGDFWYPPSGGTPLITVDGEYKLTAFPDAFKKFDPAPGHYWLEGIIIGSGGSDAWIPPGPGTYTITTLTFKVTGKGTTSLHFREAEPYVDEGHTTPFLIAGPLGSSTFYHLVPDPITDGSFSNLVPDVAVDTVGGPSTAAPGSAVSLSAQVTNQGEGAATFQVQVLEGADLIGAADVTALLPGQSQTVEVTWDTTGLAEGSYDITVSVAPLPGETDVADNEKTTTVVLGASTSAPAPGGGSKSKSCSASAAGDGAAVFAILLIVAAACLRLRSIA